MQLSELVKRDWPGMLATVVAFALFGVSLYLVIDSQYTIHENISRTEMIRAELKTNRELIINNAQRLDALQKEINKLHSTEMK